MGSSWFGRRSLKDLQGILRKFKRCYSILVLLVSDFVVVGSECSSVHLTCSYYE